MFTPEVIQVIPHENYTVDVLFQDGRLVSYDASSLINKGSFKALADIDFFLDKCTVMNHTLAWDLSGEYDPYNCLDIAPDTLYELDSQCLLPREIIKGVQLNENEQKRNSFVFSYSDTGSGDLRYDNQR